ncbi:MAG: PilZ domain-containing protein [Planctomycetes bacterium]|nr:PilZ domain-containing protein [Planctomycetota bacterium]
MKIHYHTIDNKKIALAEVAGDLIGNGALDFQESLSASLDTSDAYLLINLRKTRKIDGLGLSALDNLFSSCRHTRLFNVSYDVRSFMSLAGKAHFLGYVYHEADNENAVELFVKEFFRNNKEDAGNKRRHPRVDVRIPAVFKYHPGHNGVISGRANIINLSEGGVLAGDVVAINTTNGKKIARPALEGQKLYDIEFSLLDTRPIRARGECVREMIEESDKPRMGVRFTGIDEGDQEKIRDYAFRAFQIL